MLIEAGPFQGLPKATAKVILADPPWHFRAGKNSRHPSSKYRTMPFKEILELPVADLADPNGCRLIMWITMPFLARLHEVLGAWHFRYSTARVWVKLWSSEDGMFIYADSLTRGTGYEVIGNAELLVIAKIGRPPPIIGKKPASVFFAARREHSRKPDMIRDEIVQMFEGPRVELFARSQHPGFVSWGDSVTQFNNVA